MEADRRQSEDIRREHLTLILHRAGQGDTAAATELWPLIYNELRAVAQTLLSRERPGQTLQATALVNEAFVRLVGPAALNISDRGHFFATAAEVIRHILVDSARRKLAIKRGGGQLRVSLHDVDHLSSSYTNEELVALDDALKKLTEVSPRSARVVKYKLFAGLKADNIAKILGVSARTVDSEWAFARAWLSREMVGSD